MATMARDSSVKRLDFEDVSFTIPSQTARAEAMDVLEPEPQPEPSEDDDILEVSTGPLAADGSVVSSLPDNCSVADLRQEAQRIRKSLASVYTFVSDFSHPFQQKVKAEAEGFGTSVKQLKKLFSTLEDEVLELTVKEGVLKRLADWKIGEEKTDEDENWLKNESVGCAAVDVDTTGDELTVLKNANAELILEIGALIRTLSSDVNGLEADLSNASSCLDSFDSELDKRTDEECALSCRNNDANESLAVFNEQSENLQDLESTIRHLEETLRQNEKEYIEAEAAMESRIEQYNLEIEELQAQATQLEREEECMRLLIDVTSKSLESQKHMECSGDVSVVSMEHGSIELRLTTYVPNVDDTTDVAEQGSEQTWEHGLHVKINQETMEIEDAKLGPESVSINDLLSAAREKRVTTASVESVKEGVLAHFGRQLAFLVRAVHQRLTIHAFKVASATTAASDPRYSVEHTLESQVITIVKPGKLKVLVEVPENWPMQGFSLRLQSLQLLDAQSTESPPGDGTLKMAVEVANKMPECIRHDLLSFMQAIEKIMSE
ncbi:unnamed protein product [Calypogeia fissa]